MTLKDLEQIEYLKSEIAVLSDRLKTATTRGFTQPDNAKAKTLFTLLEKRKEELENKVIEADLFIDSIHDSKIRTILMLRYLGGHDWQWVSEHFNGMSPVVARKTAERFFRWRRALK